MTARSLLAFAPGILATVSCSLVVGDGDYKVGASVVPKDGGTAPLPPRVTCATSACGHVLVSVAQNSQFEAVAAYDENVFWSDGKTISHCRAPACDSPAALTAPDMASGISVIAANPSGVYWADTSIIYTCPLAGCGSAGRSRFYEDSAAFGVQAIAADANAVYWDDGFIVSRCLVTGCETSTTLATVGGTGWVGVNADEVFWTEDDVASGVETIAFCATGNLCGQVSSRAASGTAIAEPGYGGGSVGIASAGGSLFWLDETFRLRICTAAELGGNSSGCSSSHSIVDATQDLVGTALASDGTSVYLTAVPDSGSTFFRAGIRGVLMRCDGTGTCATFYAETVGMPGAIAVDDSNVYWTDADNRGDQLLKSAPK